MDHMSNTDMGLAQVLCKVHPWRGRCVEMGMGLLIFLEDLEYHGQVSLRTRFVYSCRERMLLPSAICMLIVTGHSEMT